MQQSYGHPLPGMPYLPRFATPPDQGSHAGATLDLCNAA